LPCGAGRGSTCGWYFVVAAVDISDTSSSIAIDNESDAAYCCPRQSDSPKGGPRGWITCNDEGGDDGFVVQKGISTLPISVDQSVLLTLRKVDDKLVDGLLKLSSSKLTTMAVPSKWTGLGAMPKIVGASRFCWPAVSEATDEDANGMSAQVTSDSFVALRILAVKWVMSSIFPTESKN
jgi:hypothetical protein